MKFFLKLKNITAISLFLFFAFISPLCEASVNDRDLSDRKVLFISSYHPGFETFFDQISGIRSVLEPRSVLLDVEFMDTKRFRDQANRDRFHSNLKFKMAHLSPYDAVITADDAAFNFALEHQGDLFKDIPIVFCGVNDVEKAVAQNKNPQVTGVVEDVSMRGTLELMLRLNPDLKEVVAISDSQISGKSDLKKFYSDKFILPQIRFSHISLDKLTWEGATEALRKLEYKTTAVLLLSAYHDVNGSAMTFDEAVSSLTEDLNVPVYHLWMHGIGKGLLGGRIISQYDQAKSAAMMVLDILGENDVASVPVLTESPNRYVFDYNQLMRFSILLSRLPENSEIINRPLSSKDLDSPLLRGALAAILGLSLMTLFISYMLVKGKRAERELRCSELKYRTLFDNASEGILVKDIEKNSILYSNPAIASMLGYSSDELRGMEENSLLYDKKTISDDRFKDENVAFKISFLRNDGSTFDAEERWTHIEIDGIECVLSFIIDITERLNMDRELESHRKHLEKLVKERTSELEKSKEEALYLAIRAQEETRKTQETMVRLTRSEKMLIQARDTADEANRAKSDFLATMSHEIRTPMNAVIVLTKLLLREKLSAKQRNYLEKVDFSAQSLLRIINDILDFSKIEAKKMELEQVEFTLEEVVLKAVETVYIDAESKGIEIHIDMSPSLPLNVEGDPLRLGQILNNLLSNSVKFTSSGDIVVTVSEVERSDKEIEVEFAVEDSGIGMTEEELNRVFEPFTQADGSITRNYKGTGLGLTISRRLCDLMGGSVSASSMPGEGSRFAFNIPLGLSEEDVLGDPLKVDGGNASDIRILLVDDNAIARKIISSFIKSMNFKIETVSSGEDALARVEKAENDGMPFNLAIIDWEMPGLNGVETAQKIAESGLNSPPKLLMVTAHRKNEVEKEAISAGFSGILIKPVQPSRLMEAVVLAVGKRAMISTFEEYKKELFADVDLSGVKILLAEDNEINQEVAEAILKDAGANVTTVKNGMEAVEAAGSNSFELILMDVQMPGMDGLEATKIIRKNTPAEEGRIPIVAMTARAMSGDREECIEAGMDDHVAKPIDPDAMLVRLHRWVSGDKVSGRLAVKSPVVSDLNVNGIDVKLGLYRTGNDQDRYLSLLRKFMLEFSDASIEIEKALEEGDLKLVLKKLHNLKGTSGNLGISELQYKTETLELALKEGEAEFPALLIEFFEAHRKIMEELGRKLPEKKAEQRGKKVLTCDDALSHLERIRSFVGKNKIYPSIKIIDEFQWPEIAVDLIGRLQYQLENYDFKASEETVDLIFSELKNISKKENKSL